VGEASLPDPSIKDSVEDIDWNSIANKPSWPQYRRQWKAFYDYDSNPEAVEAAPDQGQYLARFSPSQDPTFQAFLEDVLKDEAVGLPAPQTLLAQLPDLASEAVPQERDKASKLARFTPNESSDSDEARFVNSFFRGDSPPRASFASISMQTTWVASKLSKTDFLRFQFGTLVLILATIGLAVALAGVIKKVDSFFKNFKKK
jgi:hypothetical protein